MDEEKPTPTDTGQHDKSSTTGAAHKDAATSHQHPRHSGAAQPDDSGGSSTTARLDKTASRRQGRSKTKPRGPRLHEATATETTRSAPRKNVWSPEATAQLKAKMTGADQSAATSQAVPSNEDLEPRYAEHYACATRAYHLRLDGKQRPMTTLEDRTLQLWLAKELHLAEPPAFITETHTGAERDVLWVYQRESLGFRLYAQLPIGFSLPVENTKWHFSHALFSANTKEDDKTRVQQLLSSAHRTQCSARSQIVEFTFVRPELRDIWTDASFNIGRGFFTLRATDALALKDGEEGYDAAAIAMLYTIFIPGRSDLGADIVRAWVSSATQTPVITVTAREPSGINDFNPHLWKVTFQSIECPPELEGQRLLRVHQGNTPSMLYLHHPRAALRLPCKTCLSVQHYRRDCTVTDPAAVAAKMTVDVTPVATPPGVRIGEVSTLEQARDHLKTIRRQLAPELADRHRTVKQQRKAEAAQAKAKRVAEEAALVAQARNAEVQRKQAKTTRLRQQAAKKRHELRAQVTAELLGYRTPRRQVVQNQEKRDEQLAADEEVEQQLPLATPPGTPQTPTSAAEQGKSDPDTAMVVTVAHEPVQTAFERVPSPPLSTTPGGDAEMEDAEAGQVSTQDSERYGSVDTSKHTDSPSGSLELHEPDVTMLEPGTDDGVNAGGGDVTPRATPSTPTSSCTEESSQTSSSARTAAQTDAELRTTAAQKPPEKADAAMRSPGKRGRGDSSAVLLESERASGGLPPGRQARSNTLHVSIRTAGIGTPKEQSEVEPSTPSAPRPPPRKADPPIQLTLAQFFSPALEQQRSSTRSSHPLSLSSTNSSGESDPRIADELQTETYEEWLQALGARELKVPANGACFYFALHGVKYAVFKSDVIRASKFNVREANFYKRQVHSTLEACLEDLVTTRSVSPRRLHARYFPNSGPVSGDNILHEIRTHVLAAATKPTNQTVAPRFWAGSEEIAAAVMFLREPILVCDIVDGALSGIQMYAAGHAEPCIKGCPERVTTTILSPASAYQFVKTSMNFRVLPLVLSLHHANGGGHFVPVRFAQHLYEEWLPLDSDGATMRDRMDVCHVVLDIPLIPRQVTPQPRAAMRTETSSEYTPSSSEPSFTSVVSEASMSVEAADARTASTTPQRPSNSDFDEKETAAAHARVNRAATIANDVYKRILQRVDTKTADTHPERRTWAWARNANQRAFVKWRSRVSRHGRTALGIQKDGEDVLNVGATVAASVSFWLGMSRSLPFPELFLAECNENTLIAVGRDLMCQGRAAQCDRRLRAVSIPTMSEQLGAWRDALSAKVDMAVKWRLCTSADRWARLAAADAEFPRHGTVPGATDDELALLLAALLSTLTSLPPRWRSLEHGRQSAAVMDWACDENNHDLALAAMRRLAQQDWTVISDLLPPGLAAPPRY